MTNPVAQLDADWELVASRLQHDLPRWRATEPALRRFTAVADVHRFLRHAPSVETDAKLRALLRLTARDNRAEKGKALEERVPVDVGRVPLEALMPFLKGHAERSIFDVDDYDEVWEQILLSAWRRICKYPLRRRPRRVLVNLSLDVRHDLKRYFRRRRMEQRELGVGVDPDWAVRLDAEDEDDPDDPDAPSSGRARAWLDRLADPNAELELEAAERRADGEAANEYELLARMVEQGVLSAEESELVERTRFDGIAVRDVAAEWGVTEKALYERRRCAERKLVAALRLQGFLENESPKTHCCVEGTAQDEADDGRATGAAQPSNPTSPRAA
ncbi:MAG: hypothetical protein QOH73_2200 [Gaiellaceae bacterium]|nr:hypothetical protein [Gaiellaceae bacterium]